MKSTQLGIACLALIALAAGCEPSSETPATETRPAPARQLDRAQQEGDEAAQAVNDYAYAQKADYVVTKQAELAEINRELDQLAARIDQATDEAKTEATPKLEALRDQVARLNAHLDEAGNATESTWDNVKADFNQGYEDLKDGSDQMRQWASEKIAP